MRGTNAITGQALSGIAHLKQSVADILTTPIGTRCMRRNYGSELPELIDQPDNGATRVRLYAAAATSLMLWEPRMKVSRIVLNVNGDAAQGSRTLDVYGLYEDAEVAINVPIGVSA